MLKRASILFVIISIILIGPYFSFIQSKSISNSDTIFIEYGTSQNKILNLIAPSNVFNKLFFKIFLRLNKIETLQAGEYNIKNKPLDIIIKDISNGNTVTHKFVIKEGSNIYDLKNNIKDSTLINDCKFFNCVNSFFISKEGIFQPDTYYYKYKSNLSSILKKSNNALISYLNEIWKDKHPNNPIKTKEEALILASIIEKEAGNNNEKELIASVFLKRLTIPMRLQADPTIIYGLLPNFDGDIKKSDILDKNNIYNTYMINGLPPTPISMVSKSSLKAAIISQPGEYLFFVANSPTSHYFSKSYEEHLNMIKELKLDK